MTELYTPERKRALAGRVRRAEILAAAAVTAALLAAVSLCFGVRTGNARGRLLLCVGVCLLAGSSALAAAEYVVLPGRRMLRHMDRILSSASEEHLGRVESVGEAVRIPRSIAFVPLTVAEGEGTVPCKLALPLSGVPGAGQEIRFTVRGGYVAALETSGPLPRARLQGGGRRALRLCTRCVLCLIGLAVLWGFVFSHLTEAPAGEKVTVFIHSVRVDAEPLSAALEADLPDGIRMVQARPFTYAMMDPEALAKADLYLVSDKDVSLYADWFAPLPEGWAEREGVLRLEGTPLGVPVGTAAYMDPVSPESGEGTFYLFFGKDSLHGADGDRAALRIAERLLAPGP